MYKYKFWKLGEFMENKKLYIIISIISLVFMISSCIWECSVLNILSGIGCSGIAASIMSIFIERNTAKKEELRLIKARTLYFKSINDQLNMIFERIIWFDDRMNEPQFNWSFQPQKYSSFKYMIWANTNYKEETITFDEAEKRLKGIGEKYNLEKQNKMTDEELAKVQKMFCIIANSGNYLLNEVNVIKENKLTLNISEYLPMDKIESLLFHIYSGIGLMNSPGKNYSTAINSLLAASKIIREAGEYKDDIRIGLHGTIQINEL